MTGAGVLWSHTDDDNDMARLLLGPTLEGDPRAGRIAHLTIRAESVDLDPDAARGLRDALNLLLGEDAGVQILRRRGLSAGVPAEQQQLQARVRRIADQLGEHTTDLAEVAGRAQDPWFDVRPKEVAEVVHRLAVQQQRVAASLGDLLSALAGEA